MAQIVFHVNQDEFMSALYVYAPPFVDVYPDFFEETVTKAPQGSSMRGKFVVLSENSTAVDRIRPSGSQFDLKYKLASRKNTGSFPKFYFK